MEIKTILAEHGYPIIDGGTYLSTKALFRNGDNPTSICIYPKDNLVIDFARGERYDIKTLVGKIVGLDNEKEIQDYIQQNEINIGGNQEDIQEKLIDAPKTLSKKLLDELDHRHEYWIDRGISKPVLEKLKGGIHNGRYYFPIWSGGSFVGFTARDVTGKSSIKWLHRGKKTDWIWPSSQAIEKSKSVFLVESPGDALSLMTSGFDNVLCVFGSMCSWKIVNELLKFQGINIAIAFNGDEAGRIGANKTRSRLRKYFDNKQISIVAPIGANDWNELLLKNRGRQEIKKQLEEGLSGNYFVL